MTSVTITDNIWGVARGDVTDIEKLLRYKMPGYRFSPAGKKGWNGWIELTRTGFDDLGTCETTFPAGLVSYVMSQPWAKTWTLTDERRKPEPGLNLFSDVELGDLEPHQLAAVDAAVMAERGIVQYPTGTGKGRIIGETIRRLGVPALVVVDKVDLVEQLGDEIELCLGIKIGRMGGKYALDSDVCVIGTYQSLVKSTPGWLKHWRAVFIDEGHHAEAKSYELLLSACEMAYYRLAFSATAFKSWAGKAHDPTYLKVQAYTGPPVATMTLSEGVKTGRIVPTDIFVVQHVPFNAAYTLPHEFEPGKQRPPNYKEEYEEHIVRNLPRNAAIVKLAYSLRKSGPTVVLVQRIEHGRALAKAILCPFISGVGVEDYQYGPPSDPFDRASYYEAFKAGGTNCLVLSSIANESLDLPNIEHLILGGDNNADHIIIQQLGRGMRASTDKDRLSAIDLPVMSKYLGPHAKHRRRLYTREATYTVIDLEWDELE